MKLTILERLRLLILLPREGNIVTMRTIRKAKQSLEFKEDETGTAALLVHCVKNNVTPAHESALSLKKANCPNIVYLPALDNTFWDEPDAKNKYDPLRECKLSEAAKEIIRTILQGVGTDGKITLPDVSLCDKFIGVPEDERDEEEKSSLPEAIEKRLQPSPELSAVSGENGSSGG